MVFDAGWLMFAFHLLLRECPRTSVAVGFSYTQNQEQPLNPTTASTLAAYRDELEATGFRYEHVEQLVTEAARELVENGLTVKAADLEFGEQKKASDSVNRTISDAVQAVGDLSAMIPGVEPVGDSAWKILYPYFNTDSASLSELEQAVRAAGFHRAATYERLNGTYRNSNLHPKLADPRTLADQRWETARFDLMVAYVERHGKSSRPR